MNQKTERRRISFAPLDKAASIQLIMITIVIITYIMFLIFQRYLYSIESIVQSEEDIRSKLIIINVILAAGIVMEISYFVWTLYKKKKKAELKSKTKTKTADKNTEEQKED